MNSEVARHPSERILPVDPPYEDAQAELLARMMPPGALVEPIRLFRVLVRNEGLASAMQGFGSYALGRDLSVSREEREVVILRVCARCGCPYEWGVHVAGWADRVGLTPDQLRASVDGAPDDPAWSPTQRLLVRLVDELHDRSSVSDGLWEDLTEYWSVEQLLDLLVLVGWYHAIAFVANAAGVGAEDWAAPYPERRQGDAP